MGLRAINKAMPRTKTQADLDYDYLSSGGSYYEINGKLYREDTDDEITFGYDTGKVNAADEFRRQAFQRTPPEKLKETFGFDDQDIINFSKQQKAEERDQRQREIEQEKLRQRQEREENRKPVAPEGPASPEEWEEYRRRKVAYDQRLKDRNFASPSVSFDRGTRVISFV